MKKRMNSTKPDKKIKEIKIKISPLLKKRGIKKAGIFGSYATGKQKKWSDVDILVETPKEFSLFDLARLEIELEKKLGIKVDLLTYKSIHKLLRKRILNEEIKLI